MVAVRSALIALPKDGELICFLDGCQDRTLDIVKSISDRRLRIHISEKNVGVVEARRKLVALSKAEYIANLDADDLALPWRFKTQLRHLKSGDCDFIFMTAVLFGKNLKPFAVKPQWPVSLNEKQSDLALAFSNPFVNSSFAGRKALVTQLDGFAGAAEDYALWLKASNAGVRMRRLASYGVLYRVHDSQMTRTAEWQKHHSEDERLAVLKDRHYRRLTRSLGIDSHEFGTELLFAEYANSSFMLLLQNIGLKKLFKRLFNRHFQTSH